MDQALLIGHQIRSVTKTLAELVDAELLTVVRKRPAPVMLECPECDLEVQHDCSATAAERSGTAAGLQLHCSACAAALQHHCSSTAAQLQGYRITAYRKWNMSLDETPGQATKNTDVGSSTHARPPARGKTDRKTETVTSRPASPDGRDVTEQERAAPRSAGGAAQRAPGEGPGKFGSLPGQYRGPVREVPDFPRPPRVADDPNADSVAKARALDQLRQFAASRGLPFEPMARANGKTTAIREAFDVWEAGSGGDE